MFTLFDRVKRAYLPEIHAYEIQGVYRMFKCAFKLQFSLWRVTDSDPSSNVQLD